MGGPKTVVEGFPARRGLSGLPANRMTAKKPPGTWALALWKTKTLTSTCQHSKNKGNGQHKVTSSCISLHFSFMISMQEIPRTTSQWSTPCAFEELRVVWAQGKERLRAPCWNCQRSTNLPTKHKRTSSTWADSVLQACEARELGLKKNISKWSLWRGWKVCGLDGGTEGPLGIGDPLRPSPVTFSQKKFILSFDVPKAWRRRGAGWHRRVASLVEHS